MREHPLLELSGRWRDHDRARVRARYELAVNGMYLETHHLGYLFEYGDGDLLTGEHTFSGGDSFLSAFPRDSAHWTHVMGADWRWFCAVLPSNMGHISDTAVTVNPLCWHPFLVRGT